MTTQTKTHRGYFTVVGIVYAKKRIGRFWNEWLKHDCWCKLREFSRIVTNDSLESQWKESESFVFDDTKWWVFLGLRLAQFAHERRYKLGNHLGILRLDLVCLRALWVAITWNVFALMRNCHRKAEDKVCIVAERWDNFPELWIIFKRVTICMRTITSMKSCLFCYKSQHDLESYLYVLNASTYMEVNMLKLNWRSMLCTSRWVRA